MIRKGSSHVSEAQSITMTTSTSPSPPSILNIILLYFSLMGLGAMGGYGTFYHLFSQRCSQLVSETAMKHAASREEYQLKYEQALEGQRQCMATSYASVPKEYSEMKGRMEAQSNLAERHDALLKQQESTLTRLSHFQTAQEESSTVIASLKEQLAHAKLALTQIKHKYEALEETAHAEEESLREELESVQEVLREKEEDIVELQEDMVECDEHLPLYREEANGLKNYLRTRNHQQCKMEYGKGPFILTFTLKFPTPMGPAIEPNTFDVELAPLASMPHTIFTLLDLVDLQLFDGTAFVASDAFRIDGGSPNSASSTTSVKLHERYAKFGYHRSPLGFNEYSPDTPHAPMTIGFTGGNNLSGPGLAINLQDNTETRGPSDDRPIGEPCFGRIVRGHDAVLRIASAPRAADGVRLAQNVEIESVRLVRKTAASVKQAAQQKKQQAQQAQAQQAQAQQQTQEQQ